DEPVRARPRGIIDLGLSVSLHVRASWNLFALPHFSTDDCRLVAVEKSRAAPVGRPLKPGPHRGRAGVLSGAHAELQLWRQYERTAVGILADSPVATGARPRPGRLGRSPRGPNR